MPLRKEMRCPECGSVNAVRKGKRENKFQSIQKYLCRSCGKNFAASQLKNKTYPPRIVLSAISFYNLGHSQEAAAGLVEKQCRVRVPQRTVSEWVKVYSDVCTFGEIRKEAVRMCAPREMVIGREGSRRSRNFRVHKAKLALLERAGGLLARKSQALRGYLEVAGEECSRDITSPANGSKSQGFNSPVFTNIPGMVRKPESPASRLARLVENHAGNGARRDALQNAMLVNDRETVAVDVPVCLAKEDIGRLRQSRAGDDAHFPETRYIDMVQAKGGLIHLLCYAPGAGKVNPSGYLAISALALSSRTGLPLKDFRCAWFDESFYCGFSPQCLIRQGSGKERYG